eukprot:GCRY01002158.1.p1 GENE.GCRY01002158.1~~GCRY01002158.1.p1  ORF type:complete len:203 (+),score=32.27 GCRY01002158.1:165-773(+)
MSGETFKIVLLGEGCVGKTSLVLRYVENVFREKHHSTIQASFLSKRIVVDNTPLTLNIWDTAGQERFHALGPIYYRDADGALLVYDITDADSFQKVKNWVKELRKIVGNDINLFIVGNKSDLEKNRNVKREAAEEFAKSVGATHYESSAKQNRGVSELFAQLAKKMFAKRKDSPSSQRGARRQGLLLIDEHDEKEKKKGGCC